MNNPGESKLLASAQGKKAARFALVANIVCGIMLMAIGTLLIFENHQLGLGYTDTFPIVLIVLGAFFLVIGIIFGKGTATSLYVYEDHLMAKWIFAKKPTRIEYYQIIAAEATDKAVLKITLGAPYNKTVAFRIDGKNAQQVCYAVLSQKVFLTNKE
ncbi:MAG: hypothetical protein FWC76_02225 [Defluviitaleaceae bacterium]|nr:hypothetical protein [Defluviitaleaceae bacterium]